LLLIHVLIDIVGALIIGAVIDVGAFVALPVYSIVALLLDFSVIDGVSRSAGVSLVMPSSLCSEPMVMVCDWHCWHRRKGRGHGSSLAILV
jgi:hypothetical protein